MEWTVVALAIALVVSVTHSFYSAGKSRGQGIPARPKMVTPEAGYFVQVNDSEVDSRLLYCEEMIRKGALQECVKSAYAAAEKLLVDGAGKMGVGSEHASLRELGERMVRAGLRQLALGELELLDEALKLSGEPLTTAATTRALGAAFYVRQYFTHAPVELSGDKKPIGAEPLKGNQG